MPVYPATSSSTLYLDAVAIARATALVTPVAAGFAAYLAAHPEVSGGGAVDIAYVYFGAVTVGLNRWRAPALWAPSYPFGSPGDVATVTSFVAGAGTGVAGISITYANTDLARAAAIIAALGSVPTTANVLGQALCTGLAMLSGIDALQGPFHP